MPPSLGSAERTFDGFRGGRSTKPPSLIRHDQLAVALNGYVDDGPLWKKRYGKMKRIADVALGTGKSLWEYRKSDGTRQLLGFDSTTMRVYNDGLVQAYAPTTAWTNGFIELVHALDNAYLFNGADAVRRWQGARLYTAGLLAPSGAPTAAAPSAGGTLPAGTALYYAVTFVYGTLGESNLGPPSAGQTPNAGNLTIGLSAIPTGATSLWPGGGTSDVTARRIYRRTGTTGAWQRLKEIADNTTTTYTDDGTDAVNSLLEPPTNRGTPPLAKYGCWHNSRMLCAGIQGRLNDIDYSLQNLPDAFRAADRVSVFLDDGDTITGLVSWNKSVLIFKERQKYVMTGYGPNDWSFTRLDSIGCVDNRSISVTDQGIVFLCSEPKMWYLWNGSESIPLAEWIEEDVRALSLSFTPNFITVASQQDLANGWVTNAPPTGTAPTGGAGRTSRSGVAITE